MSKSFISQLKFISVASRKGMVIILNEVGILPQHRRMMLRVRLRLPLPARVAHHRNMPGLGSHHPPHPAPPIPHVHHRRLLLATTSVTSSTTPSSPTVLTAPVANAHTNATPLRTPAVVMPVTVPVIVVVVAVVSSPLTTLSFRLEVQTVQLFTEVVVAAVLVRVVPEVTLAGRSRTPRAERILVPELLAFTVLVKV